MGNPKRVEQGLGRRGNPALPATRPALGAHAFEGSIPDATRDTPCWAGTHQWPRHEIICMRVCVCVHVGTQGCVWVCVHG